MAGLAKTNCEGSSTMLTGLIGSPRYSADPIASEE
jgi:hypothetical protein